MNKNRHLFIFVVLLGLLNIACGLGAVNASPTDTPAQEAADTTPPVISNLTLSAQTVYYNEPTCGPTNLTVSLDAVDDSGEIAAIGLQYRYIGGQASGEWRQLPLAFAGNGKYTGTINAGAEAAGVLGGEDGSLAYQVYAIDTAGNTQTEPLEGVAFVTVKVCVGGQASVAESTPTGVVPQQADTPPPPTPGIIATLSPSTSSNLTIQYVDIFPDPVYYNGCSGNEPTTVEVMVSVNDIDLIARAEINYTYSGSNQVFVVPMARQQGIGDYTASIQVDPEADGFLNGGDGSVYITVYLVDKNGKVVSSAGAKEVRIYTCTAVGQPPPPPAAPSISISNVQANPNPVYYGLCTAGEPTVVQVQATIDPLDQIGSATVRYDYGQGNMLVASYSYAATMYQLGLGDYAADLPVANDLFGQMTGDGWLEGTIEVVDLQGQTTTSAIFYVDVKECQTQIYPIPTINYFTGPVDALAPGDPYTLQWDVSDADCGVLLDGFGVDAVGSIAYNAPADNVYQAWTHTLTAYGGPCDNPTQVSASVQILVEPSTTFAMGSGQLLNNYSLDLGDGNGDDVLFSYTTGDGAQLLSVWGSELVIGLQASVTYCQSEIDSGPTFTAVAIAPNDVVCYKTGSGNYGYLVVTGMYLDLNDPANSSIDVTYETELLP